MDYQIDLLIPANTTKGQPRVGILPVTKGLAHSLTVSFPAGCCGLAGIAIYDGLYQVWPSTPDCWYTGDGAEIHVMDLYLKQSAPFLFQVKGFNTDDIYQHIISVKIALVSGLHYMAHFLPHIQMDMLADTLTHIESEQTKLIEAMQEKPFSWID